MFLNGSYGTVNTSRLSLNNEDEDDEDAASFHSFGLYCTVVIHTRSNKTFSPRKKYDFVSAATSQVSWLFFFCLPTLDRPSHGIKKGC
mmetsp:Transcript_26229/g.29419  ORF Transcript_26229/g.29419 Transcript_26229/m.29419 type:complete len:88 (-) Transcript_26229:1235-1498(-)